MQRRYERLDVFTDVPFGGNPLAVFLDADGLDPATMQRIAGELNLSETVFLTALSAGEWRARIFAPAVELPFAGHPSIGAALALYRAGRLAGATALVLHESVGAVAVAIEASGAAARFRVPGVPEVREAVSTSHLADLLDLAPGDILDGAWRPRAVSCGVPFHIVALRDQDAIATARLRLDRWRLHLNGHWAPHVYVVAAGSSKSDADFYARMFAPAMGVVEDPATGGAAAALAAFLAAAEPERCGSRICTINQGVELGRPSRLTLRFDIAAGVAEAIDITGSAVSLGWGFIDTGRSGDKPVPEKFSRELVEPYGLGDGCLGWRLLDGDELAVVSERMPPGSEERRRRHAAARQLFYVLSGSLEIEAANALAFLAPGESIEIAPGVGHRVINRSTADADFLVIASPSTRGDRIDCTEER